MRHYIISLFVIVCLGLAMPVQADKIIRWVDQNGVTHFSDKPPIGQMRVEEVRVQPTNRADVPTKVLSSSLRASFAAVEQNRSPETRSVFLIKGPPKRVLTPMARPFSKHLNGTNRGRGR